MYFPKPTVPVRLGEDLKGIKVFVPDSNGDLIEATADLFAGQWILTHPDDWPDSVRREFQNIKREKSIFEDPHE